MARPEVSDLTEQLYEALGWHTEQDEAHDWPLLRFCAAWVETLLDPVYQYAAEDEDGSTPWTLLFDPDNCPEDALPYLAQYVGVIVTPEMTTEQLREEIKEPTGWSRGREASVKLVAARGLTGTKRVIIRPRKPAPGETYIRTLLSETPDPERTEALIRAALPAWEKLSYEAIAGVTWEDVEAAWETWEDLEADFATWNDLEDLLPEELPP